MLIMIFSVWISACFPIYKLILPELVVNVFDETGMPLKNVEIVLCTEVSPAKKEFKPLKELSNDEGRAEFKS